MDDYMILQHWCRLLHQHPFDSKFNNRNIFFSMNIYKTILVKCFMINLKEKLEQRSLHIWLMKPSTPMFCHITKQNTESQPTSLFYADVFVLFSSMICRWYNQVKVSGRSSGDCRDLMHRMKRFSFISGIEIDDSSLNVEVTDIIMSLDANTTPPCVTVIFFSQQRIWLWSTSIHSH